MASIDLAQRLVSNPDPTAAEMAAAQTTLLAGEARNAVYASAISEMGYVLGTWRQVSDGGFLTYYVEPGFVSSSSDERYNATLFAFVENATDPAVENQVALLNTALTDQGQLLAGFSAPTVTPAQGNVVWQNSSDAINQLLYCGYRQANCYEGYNVVNEYTGAFDFLNTSTSDALYNVVVWFNGTGKWSVWQGAPNIVRVNQGINLATNAYLQQGLGDGYRARLLGFMDVPKVRAWEEIVLGDFSRAESFFKAISPVGRECSDAGFLGVARPSLLCLGGTAAAAQHADQPCV